MSLQLNDQKQNELENVNEVLNIVEESKKSSKTTTTTTSRTTEEKSNEEVVLENLNEVITFEVPVSEVQTLNE